jgi:hypothetical protein
MLTAKPILLALIAACGVTAGAASFPASTESLYEQPDEIEPPDGPPIKDEGYLFCCQDADAKTQSGEGCVTIGEKEIDRCNTVLACKNFVKKDNKVVCIPGE